MGKAKKNVQEDNYSFVVDLKSVLALKPEHRVKWLQKACRAVSEGEASVKHLFDVLTNKKLIHGMPTKSGHRMFRMLQDNLYLFSEKQQRYLQEESALATEFDVRSEDEAPQGSSERGVDESAIDVGGSSSGGGAPATDMASRMEEMMARCRDFVRAKASTFEERTKEAEETEKRAEEERKRAQAEQRKREWDAIDVWHRQLEDWESACMAALDERFARLLVLQRRAEAEAAEAAAAGEEALKVNMQAASKRKRRSSESSGDDDAAVFKSSRRRRSRSRSGRRRRRDASPRSGPDIPPPLSAPGAEESRSGEGRRSSRRKFTEDSLDPRQRQSIAQAEEHAQAQMKVQEEVQKVLGQVGGSAAHQGGGRSSDPPPVRGTLAEMLRGGGGR